METTHKKIIHSSDVSKFADISDDFNLVHVAGEYAKEMGVGKRIALGMISSSIFWVSTKLKRRVQVAWLCLNHLNTKNRFTSVTK